MDVRDSNGITVYLQYQKGTLLPASGSTKDVVVAFSWIPEANGDYVLRSFVVSDLSNPLVLSDTRQSEIAVGVINLVSEGIFVDDTPLEPAPGVVVVEEGQEQEAVEPTLHEQLVQYALSKINKDRQDYHLPPVQLSDNMAAQFHAADVYANKYISHWVSDGDKPYMTYSRYGGRGDVGQNVAVSGDLEFWSSCMSAPILCEKIDPYDEIEAHEYGMMYDDLECCENGHRDNILDPHHTHVSIGTTYDDYFFVMVQNLRTNMSLGQTRLERKRIATTATIITTTTTAKLTAAATVLKLQWQASLIETGMGFQATT
jgi:uncharacterized protein YkwD